MGSPSSKLLPAASGHASKEHNAMNVQKGLTNSLEAQLA